MKTLLVTSLIIFAGLRLIAQDFAPIGAKWYYDEVFAFSGDIDYIMFHSEKDTLINGEICRKITKRHKDDCNDRPSIEYLFTRNDTVFFLDTIFDGFQILYDFNAQISDSWIIKVKDEEQDIDTVKITVDSISYQEINQMNLKSLHVTYYKFDENMPLTYQSIIVERIGDIRYMINWYPWSLIVCDLNYSSGLRCYEDNEVGLYSTGTADSCDYSYKWIGLNDNAVFNYSIYPNPTSGLINIEVNSFKNIKIEITNLMGQSLLQTEFQKRTQLDITKIRKGIYLMNVYQDETKIRTEKIIKY